MGDSFALAKAGKLGADAVLKLLAAFKNETAYTVWDAIDLTLRGFDRVLMSGTSDEIYSRFEGFVAGLIKKPAADIGWEKKASDGHLDGLLRQSLISMQSKFSKDNAVIADAKRRFDAFLGGDASALPDDIKVAVFKIVMKAGGPQEYEALRKLHTTAATNLEKTHVYNAIGYTRDMAKKKEILEWAISGEIKIQDFFYAIGSVASSSKDSVSLCWSFFKDNFDRVQGLVKTANPSLMDAVIEFSTRGFCSATAADEIDTFFKEHPLPQNKRKVSQILEEMRANAAFLDRILKTSVNDVSFWDGL